jgi:hypothetical protein
MQVLPTAPSPTVTHLMNLAVLIVPLFFLTSCPHPAAVVGLDACLFSVGCSGGYGQIYLYIYIYLYTLIWMCWTALAINQRMMS